MRPCTNDVRIPIIFTDVIHTRPKCATLPCSDLLVVCRDLQARNILCLEAADAEVDSHIRTQTFQKDELIRHLHTYRAWLKGGLQVA